MSTQSGLRHACRGAADAEQGGVGTGGVDQLDLLHLCARLCAFSAANHFTGTERDIREMLVQMLAVATTTRRGLQGRA